LVCHHRIGYGECQERETDTMTPSSDQITNASPTNPHTQKARSRRWLRFSLRTFLLVLTALCIWLGFKVNQARRQKEAVAGLKAVGMRFYYAHQRDDAYPNSIDPGRELAVPKWLEELAGYDFFRTVISVQGLGQVTDDDLRHLAGLPYVEHLYVWGSEVSDAGLAHLRRPDRLVSFGTYNSLVGDGFLKRLCNSTRLERLALGRSEITDEGLLAIRTVTKLKRLGLSGSKITDAGMAALDNMTALEIVDLDRTEVTDAGLIHLKNAKRLRHLGLSRTSITDAGLEHLHGFPELQSVTLDDTAATPDGIAALKAATPTLRAVDQMNASRLRDADDLNQVAKLRKPRPPRRSVQPPGSRLPAQNKADAAH
jgi:hypothetical protein